MTAFNKVNVFTTDVADAKHDFSAHTFKWLFTNTAPTTATAVKADLTEISAGNGYTAGGPTSAVTLSTASGVEKIVLAAATVTASGAIGPFRYVALYNDTQTSPVKPVIGWYDYGSPVTMAFPQTFTITPDQSAGWATLT